MPKKKKNVFDSRDALEVLRDAFFDTSPPHVAELETSPVKTHTVADKYREEIPLEDMFEAKKAPGRKRQENKLRKRTPYNEEEGELPTFWNEKAESQEPAEEKPKEPAPTPVEIPAVPLSEQSPTPQPPLKLSPEEHKIFEKIRGTYEKKIESAEANDLTRWENEGGAVLKEKIEPPRPETLPSLPISEPKVESASTLDVETYAQRWANAVSDRPTIKLKETGIELMEKRLNENAKISNSDKTLVKTIKKRALEIVQSETQPPSISPESPKIQAKEEQQNQAIFDALTAPKQPPKAEDPLKAERAEQVKQFLAEKEAEVYHSNIPEMEKRIQYLYDNKTKEGKPDLEAIERLQRAIEITKAKPPKPAAEPTPVPMPNIKTVEEQLAQNIAKVTGETSEEKKETEKENQWIVEKKSKENLEQNLKETYGLSTQEAEEKDRALAEKGLQESQKQPKMVKFGLSIEDLPKEKTKPESHEDRIKTFEEKTAALEKTINENGGTREEKDEHAARQAAHRHGYDPKKITDELAQLRKSKNRVENIFKMQALEAAQKLVETEIGEKMSKSEPLVALETISPEIKQETTPTEANKAFEEFGISKEDLAQVEGFSTLNDNQKAFIFENLRRVLYADIETRAKAMLTEETSKLSTTRRTGRKAFEGFAGQGSKLIVKEAEALKAIRTGGIAIHGETLKLLVNLISREEVKLNPDTGVLEVSYINPDMFGTAYKEEIDQYNAAAQRFAGIPETWSYPSASKKNRQEYQTARAQYEEQRNNVLKYVFAKTNDDASARQFMLERDSQVAMQRVFSAYPQMEAILQNIARIENQDIGKAGRRGFYSESGWKAGIAGLSSFARYKAIIVLGYSATEAAIGIGGIVNGARETWRARMKAREELEAARQNLTKKELAAAKLKSGRSMLGLGGLVKGIGKKERLRTAGHALRKTTLIDASNYAKRIDNLLQKINDPASIAEKRKLSERQLYRLIKTAEEHMSEGLVNFGKGSSHLAASCEFVNQLSHAEVELVQKGFFKEKVAKPELYTFGGKEKISVEKFMEKKLGRLSKEEKTFILRGFMRGLAVGAVAGGVGAAFGGWLKDRFGDDIQEWIGSARGKTGLGGKTVAAPKNLPISPETILPTSGERIAELVPAGKSGKVPSLEEIERELRKKHNLAEPGAGDATVNWEALKKPLKVSPDTGEVLSDAQREAAQRAYQGLGEPDAGDSIVNIESGFVIGKRGPEGIIIDQLKSNLDLAKKFGWDGKGNISEWAGGEAHRMWLRHAEEAIKDPALIEQMKKLGYLRGLSKASLGDKNVLLGRYTEMMHHIKKGSSLLFNAKEKSLDFSHMMFLTARH